MGVIPEVVVNPLYYSATPKPKVYDSIGGSNKENDKEGKRKERKGEERKRKERTKNRQVRTPPQGVPGKL